MSCVALAGRPLAIFFWYMRRILFYHKFSQKCDATEHLILFSGEPILAALKKVHHKKDPKGFSRKVNFSQQNVHPEKETQLGR